MEVVGAIIKDGAQILSDALGVYCGFCARLSGGFEI